MNFVSTHANSALFITFDEAAPTDTSGCCNQPPLLVGGGHIGLVMVAPSIEKAHYKSTVPANLYSLLHTIEAGFGVPALKNAATAPAMADLFR